MAAPVSTHIKQRHRDRAGWLKREVEHHASGKCNCMDRAECQDKQEQAIAYTLAAAENYGAAAVRELMWAE